MLGIKGHEDALAAFNEMKLRKKVAFMTFKIDGKVIVVDKQVAKEDCKDSENYLDEFIEAVKETGEPRFCVVDHNHKLLFVGWVPETAKAQLKMKYASVKENFAQELVGLHAKLQATDDGELSKEAIQLKTKSKV